MRSGRNHSPVNHGLIGLDVRHDVDVGLRFRRIVLANLEGFAIDVDVAGSHAESDPIHCAVVTRQNVHAVLIASSIAALVASWLIFPLVGG